MMSKDNNVSNAEFARVKRNCETFALLRTFAMAVLSSAGERADAMLVERNKGKA